MASLRTETLPSGKTSYAVRWRERNGRQHTQRFDRKAPAERRKSKIENDLNESRNVDPKRGSERFADTCRRYVETATIRESTRAVYKRQFDSHVIPELGQIKLNEITVDDIAKMRDKLVAKGVGKATVIRAMKLTTRVMNKAIEEGRIDRNVASVVSRPYHDEREPFFMKADEVRRLADSCSAYGDQYGTLVRFLGATGLRFGEAAALRVGDVDLGEKPKVRVTKSITEVEGKLVAGKPKTDKSKRSVPMPKTLRDELARFVEGRDETMALFTGPRGGPLRNNLFRTRILRPAARDAGVLRDGEPPSPHALRHTAISLWGRAGYGLTEAQAWAGHSSSTMTSRYSHYFEDSSDMSALDVLVAPPKPELKVVESS